MSERDSTISPLPSTGQKRHVVTILILVVGLAVLGSFWFAKYSTYSVRLTTCFQNASGLRAGTVVKLAGVEVGRVNSVRAQPTEPDCPAAVTMELRTPYELSIPRDAIATIASDGILGPEYLAIDVSHASAPAIQSGGRLPSKEAERFTAGTVDRILKGIEVMKQLADEERKTEPRQEDPSHSGPPPSRPARPK